MDEMDVADDGDIPLPQQHLFLDQAKQYNFVAVREMLEASPGLVNVQPAMRWSALHQAAEAGDEAAVSFLLERGADKTLKTKDGRTPLQVTKNAAVRALLGGEKRTAPEGPAEGASPKAAKVSALSLVLKVNYAASGAELASLTWSSKGSVEDLKEELRKKLEPGKVVRTLLKENYPLPDGTLEDAGVENGAILNAVIDVEPILFLFKPCTASELCSRHQDWCAGEEEDLVQSERAHLAMDQAPEVARKVAEELNEACPGLGGFQVCRSSEGDSPGELLVIANAGEDPKKSCLKALVFPKDSEEWQDKVDENDPECTGLWALATLEKVEWKDYLDKGFNAHKDDDPETMVADGLSSEELEEYRKATKIMNEKLEKHFIFNFSDDAQGKGKFDDGEGRVSDGLILSNVPAEVNTLDALNRHFRHFGEVLKITSQVNEGKAYVQFASKASAEAAASVPVLDRPEITVAWLLRPKGKGSGKGKSDGRPAENRILCTDPEEQRKIEDMKIKREEVASRKTALLANLTNQIKAIMAKISDASVSEAKRETLRTLLLGLKEKLDSLSGPKQDTRMLGPPRSKQLDLRTRLLKFQLTEETSLEALREELRKLAGDQVADLRLEDGHFAVAQFKDRLVAEKVWNQKTELSRPVEWYEAVREARDEEVQEALTADGEGFPAQDFTSEAYAEAPHGEEEMAAPMAAPEESAEPFTDTGLGPETADAPRDADAPSAADTPHATDAPSAADAPRAADVPSAGDPPSASAGDAPSNVTAAIAEENQPETTGVTKDPGAVTTVTGDAATEAVDHGADWGDVTADTSVEAQGEAIPAAVSAKI